MANLDDNRDFYAWAAQSPARLRAGLWAEVDAERIAEELEDLGKQQTHALAGHLKVLMLHLLKWRHQPAFRGVSGRLSIDDARDEIGELLEDSPSLKSQVAAAAARRYPAARTRASLETGLPPVTFPAECPFTTEQLLDSGFFPE